MNHETHKNTAKLFVYFEWFVFKKAEEAEQGL